MRFFLLKNLDNYSKIKFYILILIVLKQRQCRNLFFIRVKNCLWDIYFALGMNLDVEYDPDGVLFSKFLKKRKKEIGMSKDIQTIKNEQNYVINAINKFLIYPRNLLIFF